MVWGAFSYHGRCNLQQLEGNLNSNVCIREILLPEIVPFLQFIPGTILQLDIARPFVAKIVRDSFSAYSPDMSPIEHVKDVVGRRLARHPRPATSKNEI